MPNEEVDVTLTEGYHGEAGACLGESHEPAGDLKIRSFHAIYVKILSLY